MEHLPPIGPDAVRDLYQQFIEVDDDGSSNDVCQMLDDWFTDNGWPTVLYRPKPKRRRP